MAMKPTDVSGGSIASPCTGKTVAGQEKRHDVIEADTGRYHIEGSAIRFVQASAQAETALGVLSSTATNSGNLDVAQVAQKVELHFHNWNIVIGDGNTINNLQSADIDQEISQMQQLAQQMEEKLTAAGVDFYDCVEQRKACLAGAKNKFDIGECWAAHIGCMSIKGASVFRLFSG